MALKIGSEDKKKVAIAGVLGVIVLFLVGRMVFQTFISPGTPPPVTSAPPVASATPVASAPNSGLVQSRTSRGHEAAKVTSPLAKLDPTLHPEWMAEAESLEYTGKGRNIFSMFSEPAVIEAVKGPIRPGGNVPVVPAGPPPPPPIDLKFFGYEASKVDSRKAFLLHGDDVFIASEGDVVDHRYKVVAISPFSMQVEDIPYHNTQTLPLVQN